MGLKKLAACVILYNPDNDVCSNIESYIRQTDKLFLVDNGNGAAVINYLTQKYNNIITIEHDENRGIANPLNEVLKCVENKYDFLMTMDQDSRFCDGSMQTYISELDKFNWNETIGIGPKTVEECKCTDKDVLWGGYRVFKY